jgi:hypothetical protein
VRYGTRSNFMSALPKVRQPHQNTPRYPLAVFVSSYNPKWQLKLQTEEAEMLRSRCGAQCQSFEIAN